MTDGNPSDISDGEIIDVDDWVLIGAARRDVLWLADFLFEEFVRSGMFIKYVGSYWYA